MSSVAPCENLPIPAETVRRALRWTSSRRVPRSVALAIDASIWMMNVDALRNQEEDLMVRGLYDKALGEHRVIISRLIKEGELILRRAKRAAISRFQSGFTVDDFEATLDAVRVTLRCQHGPKNPQNVNALIERLLDVS